MTAIGDGVGGEHVALPLLAIDVGGVSTGSRIRHRSDALVIVGSDAPRNPWITRNFVYRESLCGEPPSNHRLVLDCVEIPVRQRSDGIASRRRSSQT
jgi:hypothetical protein